MSEALLVKKNGDRRKTVPSSVVNDSFNDSSISSFLSNGERDSAVLDLQDLFARERSGHLIKWMYLSPRSLEAWSNFMTHDGYYVTAEKSLIKAVAKKDLSPIVRFNDSIIGIENGPGSESAMLEKSAPFWRSFENLTHLIARDRSPTVVLDAPKVLEKKLPNTLIVPNEVDYLKDGLPSGLPSGRRLMAEFGITIGNKEGFASDVFPASQFKKDLKAHRKNLREGDIYTLTFDANQDKESVEYSYTSEHLTEWGQEMFRIMKSDLPIDGDFDPEAFMFMPTWFEEPHHVNENAMIATRNMEFTIADQEFSVVSGEAFAITNSYKPPLELFLDMVDKANFEVLSHRQDRNKRITQPVLQAA